MSQSFKIKIAAADDIPLIRALTYKVWPQTYAAIISRQQIDYMLDLMYSVTSLQNQMKEGSQFIIVFTDDEPAGFASTQETEPGIFKLHKIYILPSQQGKGIGKFVIDYIMKNLRIKGGTALQLQVNRYNRAKEFYLKLGFSVIEEADFDIGGGYFMNDYVMGKKL